MSKTQRNQMKMAATQMKNQKLQRSTSPKSFVMLSTQLPLSQGRSGAPRLQVVWHVQIPHGGLIVAPGWPPLASPTPGEVPDRDRADTGHRKAPHLRIC